MFNEKNYLEILNHPDFGEIKISNRIASLYKIIKLNIENRKLQDRVYVNQDLLHEVVLNYFVDIKRVKDFHGLEKANAIKVSAYLTYWFLRGKPIQIKEDIQEKSDILLWINELVAFPVLIGMCFNRNDRQLEKSEEMRPYTELMDLATYNFIYRPISPQANELLLTAYKVYCPYPLIARSD